LFPETFSQALTVTLFCFTSSKLKARELNLSSIFASLPLAFGHQMKQLSYPRISYINKLVRGESKAIEYLHNHLRLSVAVVKFSADVENYYEGAVDL